MDAVRSPVESRLAEGALTDTEGEGEEMPVVEAALTDIEGEGEGITGDVGITTASTSRQVLSLQNKNAWLRIKNQNSRLEYSYPELRNN